MLILFVCKYRWYKGKLPGLTHMTSLFGTGYSDDSSIGMAHLREPRPVPGAQFSTSSVYTDWSTMRIFGMRVVLV